MESYRVRVEKSELVFSAGHFITFEGGHCERLHGHNYSVAAEVEGALGEHHYVVDFGRLSNSLRTILLELDHHMLLATQNPHIRVEADGEEVTVAFGDRRWVFPRGDCVLLPIANTTAELLARHIGIRLQTELQQRGGPRLSRIRVEVDECFGQSAFWETTL